MKSLLRVVACFSFFVSLNSFGALYAMTASNTYAIDPQTGETLNSYGFAGNNYGTGALAYAPVPLPAGIYLFLSGLVGLGLMRGRNA